MNNSMTVDMGSADSTITYGLNVTKKFKFNSDAETPETNMNNYIMDMDKIIILWIWTE